MRRWPASVRAFSGLAAADCSDGHSQKDVMAPGGPVLASQAPSKSTALPATIKQVGAAKPAVNAQTAKAPSAPATKERTLVASQCEGASCK